MRSLFAVKPVKSSKALAAWLTAILPPPRVLQPSAQAFCSNSVSIGKYIISATHKFGLSVLVFAGIPGSADIPTGVVLIKPSAISVAFLHLQ